MTEASSLRCLAGRTSVHGHPTRKHERRKCATTTMPWGLSIGTTCFPHTWLRTTGEIHCAAVGRSFRRWSLSTERPAIPRSSGTTLSGLRERRRSTRRKCTLEMPNNLIQPTGCKLGGFSFSLVPPAADYAVSETKNREIKVVASAIGLGFETRSK